MFAVLVLTVHAIQAAIMTLVAKDMIKLTKRDYIELLLFGFFRMIELRGAIYEAAQKKKAEIEAKRNQKATLTITTGIQAIEKAQLVDCAFLFTGFVYQ